MIITTENAMRGNQAIASVLLLYFHLLRDGGFANDQTVYIDAKQFNGFDYIEVEVSAEYAQEIDQQLLREGAVVYLLCDLQDAIGEHEDDFLSFPAVQEIISSLTEHGASVAPEVSDILRLLQADEQNFDHAALTSILSTIFNTYVVSRFATLSHQEANQA